MEADKSNYHLYNKNLRGFAWENRNKMTRSEVRLWMHVLRASKLKGYVFRRQRPVMGYIADFMCPALKLIIEVDGPIHEKDLIRMHDERRQSRLEASGFTVIRFTNDEVNENLDGVVQRLEQWIDAAVAKGEAEPPRIRQRGLRRRTPPSPPQAGDESKLPPHAGERR